MADKQGSTNRDGFGGIEDIITIDPGDIAIDGSETVYNAGSEPDRSNRGGNDNRDNANGQTRQRRKRRTREQIDAEEGTKRPRREKTSQASIDIISSTLFSCHNILAGLTKIPELALPKEKTEEIAKAIEQVRSFYPETIIDPKTLAWLNLGRVTVEAYIPFGVNSFIRASKRKKQPQPQAQPQPFTNHAPFNPAMNTHGFQAAE